jgi:hypothetical protein
MNDLSLYHPRESHGVMLDDRLGHEAACRHSVRAMNAALRLLAALNCSLVTAMY